MSYERLPYADAESLPTMSTDCLEAGSNLHLPGQRDVVDTDLFQDAVSSRSSFASSVAVPDSLARLAGELELHFD